MDLMLNIDLKKLSPSIVYRDKIMLIGSCFTEHIGNALAGLKFTVMQNPNGILFGPDAVCKSLVSYTRNDKYKSSDLFQLNEIWHSWQHHSRFSNIDPDEATRIINASQQKAHEFLKEADWLIITLGSSFSYRLTNLAESSKTPGLDGPDPANEGGEGKERSSGEAVANCHRAPAPWFDKQLLEIPAIISMLENCIRELSTYNPKLKIIFTVSPVRHIRDGVVENNRSKARLLEAVHHIVSKFDQASYFAAYELVIDVLRDYRFYDMDLVHPNYPATEFVLEKFAETCIDDETQQLMLEVKRIVIARKHKAFQPETKAHQQFLVTNFEKTKALQLKYPFLDLKEELVYFSQT
ncbi:MAG: GSCFA domain-containing protein [Ferruginibacter sp.]|nr:GSCFA domain-containing protein [Chitinophagaceae bacterium]